MTAYLRVRGRLIRDFLCHPWQLGPANPWRDDVVAQFLRERPWERRHPAGSFSWERRLPGGFFGIAGKSHLEGGAPSEDLESAYLKKHGEDAG